MNDKSPLIPGFVRAPQKATINTQFSIATVKNGGIPGVVRTASNIQGKQKTKSREKRANGTVQIPQNDELTKQAVDEILRETRTSKTQTEQNGPTARKRCPIQKTNKRFLNRTIISAVNHNNREGRKVKQRSKEKLTEHVRKGNVQEPSRKDQNPPIIVID
uniref:Putative agap008937-pa-like protein n=1 Tax=Anopheles darlingi TaxID=43151 RepID=A0A2M4CKW1_ANODA